MKRSLIRPNQLNSNGSYEFAQIIIDGYSGGSINDGYLTGIILKDRKNYGSTTLTISADDGQITQFGNGTITFNGNVEANSNVTIQGSCSVDGYAILGNSLNDHIVTTGTFYSDIIPDDCSYQVGSENNKWIDGYFCFSAKNKYTPVGNSYSLQGHLKGIDEAFATITDVKNRGIYEITISEASQGILDTTRIADQGNSVDVGSLTDEQFENYVFIYLNGRLLYNDTTTAINSSLIQNNIARHTGTPNEILFSGRIRSGTIIQIISFV